MAKYLFLDQSSARIFAFAPQLNDSSVKVVVGDVYFTEFSQAEAPTVQRHLDRLREFGGRLYFGRSATECLKRELSSLRRTNRDVAINSEATVWMREKLTETRPIAELITGSDIRKTVIEDRYSNQMARDTYKGMVRMYERAMKITKHNVPFGTPLDEAVLRDTIALGRYSVFKYLADEGRGESDARRFAMKDTFMLRDICARLCRIADWAQSKGIDGQNAAHLDNEGMDMEYVVLAGYFDEFLTSDQRNQRNDVNLRRLLALVSDVRKMREPSIEERH